MKYAPEVSPPVGSKSARLNVEYATDKLLGSVELLASSISKLEDRLEPILCPPAPSQETTAREQGPSELADQLLAVQDTVSTLSDRLERLMSRL